MGKDTSKGKKLYNAMVYPGVDDTRGLVGKQLWEKLNNSLISEPAKTVVSADPNLSKSTLNKLYQLQGGTLQDVDVHFGSFPKDETERPKKDNDAGLAVISCCIKMNPQATWAEFCARYAAARHLPFLEIAVKLKELEREHGLFYFDEETGYPMVWHPSRASIRRDLELKKRTSINDEWDEIDGPVL